MKDATHIAVLLDRSGSMGEVKAETISGFNHFLKEQKSAGDNATLTLVQFDSEGIDTVFNAKPIKDVPDLTPETYEPRSWTPLLDALGKTINDTGTHLANTSESERPDKVVFVVITDGQENASREFTRARIKEMINHQSDVYKWQFVYLGANQDAFAEAQGMGMNRDNVANYEAARMNDAFAFTTANVARYRRTGVPASLKYSTPQRDELMKKDEKEEAAQD